MGKGVESGAANMILCHELGKIDLWAGKFAEFCSLAKNGPEGQTLHLQKFVA
jgi:hypothetical protein